MSPYESITCPKCGAQSWDETYQCWLCRERSLAVNTRGPPPAAQPWQRAEPGALAQALTGTSTMFLFLAAILVGIGLTALLPILGIAFGLFVLIPLVSATIMRRRGHAKAAMNWRQRVSNFFLSFTVVVAILMALGIAGIVAFFVNCVVNPQPLFIAP
jgi:hypothetical protein